MLNVGNVHEREQLVGMGTPVATPGALQEITRAEIIAALRRHENGDWGDMSAADRARNDRARLGGERLFSVYRSSYGVRFYVITEWDRSRTTVLLPSEY